MMVRKTLCRVLVLILVVSSPLEVFADSSSDAVPADGALSVSQRVQAVLDRAEATGDFQSAAQEASALFTQVVVWGDTSNRDLFIETAFARRLLTQLEKAEGIDRVAMLKYLRANTAFAHALAFLVRQEEDPSEIYAVVDRLRSEHGDQLDDYATLAAALCVVYDKPLERWVNENRVSAEDPVQLFQYYRVNERKMLFGIKDVPGELLVYVVDSTASIPEMNWALKKYAGDKSVGKRFFDIQYDYDHFRQGTTKKVTKAGFNLPNILEYGGVCADQAYFAVAIGKAIGVPTAYTRGRSSVVSHAWVGYLQARGKNAGWNFNEGRYEVYRGVRGVVEDPQTREPVPDSVVSLLSEMIGYSITERHAAAALIDATQVLLDAGSADELLALPKPSNEKGIRDQARTAGKASQLELLEAGLRRCPGYPAGWHVLATLASEGKLNFAEKKRWSTVLMNLCGDKYPDFTLAILEPMIQTMQDPKDQNQIWESAGKLFTKRKDLSAEVLMAQGRMWEDHGEQALAGKCYEEVVDRYVNDGPFVLEALDRIELLLREAGKPDRVLLMYDRTWAKVKKPGKMAPTFRKQSNWYKIGKRYVERLREFGYDDRAAKAEAVIKRVTGG